MALSAAWKTNWCCRQWLGPVSSTFAGIGTGTFLV
jgi:hypothetical protein